MAAATCLQALVQQHKIAIRDRPVGVETGRPEGTRCDHINQSINLLFRFLRSRDLSFSWAQSDEIPLVRTVGDKGLQYRKADRVFAALDRKTFRLRSGAW